jgi:hypothetical protein
LAVITPSGVYHLPVKEEKDGKIELIFKIKDTEKESKKEKDKSSSKYYYSFDSLLKQWSILHDVIFLFLLLLFFILLYTY